MTVNERDVPATFRSQKQHRVCYADPPWVAQQQGARGAVRHYDLMSTDRIKQMPIADFMADDSTLLLWTTATPTSSSTGSWPHSPPSSTTAERTEANAALHDWQAQQTARNSAEQTSPRSAQLSAKTKEASRLTAEGFLGSVSSRGFLSNGLNILDVVGVKGLKPSTSRSQTGRAINCATPRQVKLSMIIRYFV